MRQSGINDMSNIQSLHEVVFRYVKANWKKSFNEPTGILKYKFLDPAAVYRAQLWDWDSFFCGMSLIDIYEDTAEYVKGCVLNFLSHQRQDGSIPYMINVSEVDSEALPRTDIKTRSADSDLNSIKPLLAQMVMMVYKKDGDSEWIKDNYSKLIKHVAHWEATQRSSNGLFVWRSYRGSGTDNHPALYGRPLNSSAGVELNCFMYLEYIAMSDIASICSDTKLQEEYKDKAKALADTINACMYDPIDEMYYNLDVTSVKPPLACQEISWNIPLKFRVWTGFMPMYAQIAPKEYADRLLQKHIMNEKEFLSDYGLRTTAKNEPLYNVKEMSNPSNWQGPIWILSTYLIFRGMLNYGYIDEARLVAENMLSTLVKDLKENGAFHEYYNPETGKSTINLGFMNWNGLAALMLPELLEAIENN